MDSPKRSPSATLWRVASLVLVFAAHLGLLAYFVGVEVWFGDRPMTVVDYDTHIAQTWRVLEGLEGWGRAWVYDVQLLAGQPAGVIFDADNKGWELWTYALHRAGFSKAVAFNSFILLTHVAVVPTLYAAARLFRLEHRPALIAAGLGGGIWFFDSFAHWCWIVGMISYAFASYLVVLALAFFYRFTDEFRPAHGVGAAVTLALAHLVHPYSFFIALVPMLALYGRSFRAMRARQHASVVLGIAGFVILVNAYWLRTAFRFWHYILDSAYFGESGVSFIFGDLLALLLDPKTSGLIGTRTSLRIMVAIACVLTLLRWRRERDARMLPFATAVATMFLLGYFGSYSHAIAQIQPYRHVLPFAFLCVIPAAACFEQAARWLRDRPWRARRELVLVLIPVALALQDIARDVAYYFAPQLPTPAPMSDGAPTPLGAAGYGIHPDFRWSAFNADIRSIEDWVREHDDGQGRFLVEFPPLGDRLSWVTDAQILGGFTLRNLQHSDANLFRRRRLGIASDAELREYFETYAVRWVIISTTEPYWTNRPELLELVHSEHLLKIYRTKVDVDLVAEGGGVVTAETNRLTVKGSDPDADVVLRFHWLETLECAPDCRIEREPAPRDRVGFIRVPAPHPADFVIENGY